jgi:hypothetical protein
MVPDYYARLGVDPGADRAVIEAALKRLQPAWSMGTRNPKTRHSNQLYLDEIPALRKALFGDPASRAAYDAELAMTQAAEKDRKRDELERRIRLRSAKGGLGLTEDDVLRLTRPIPELFEVVSVDGETEPDHDPPADVLDPSTRRQIRVALEHLGCRDLYDALAVLRDAPASEIAARADVERQRWMKKAQVTAEKTAWLEIITHAQSHLGTTKSRARYDRTLALETEETFEGLVTFAIQGLARLDLGTQSALIEEAAAAGVPAERAERLIGRVCRQAGVACDRGIIAPQAVAVAPAAAAPSAGPAQGNGAARFSLLRCRRCSGVSEMSPVARKAAAARCRHCGASLKWDCPVCKRSHWVDERRCTCGFRQALGEPLARHFEAAQQAFRDFDLERALEHLTRVQEFAPNLAGARNGIAKIRQRQADIARVQLTYETARAGGRLVSARAAAEAWSRLVDPSSPELQSVMSELARGLRRAELLAARAHNLERTDPAAARDLYRQSLAIAADLPDALAGLKRTPPDAPTVLDAQILGDRIRLSWAPPAPDGLGPLTFVVVRKRGGSLQHPSDGTRIAEVSASEFDDMHVPPGDTVGYAVVSKRGGVESTTAISLGPFVFLADVTDVRLEFRHQEVELAWALPRGVTEVRVIRKRGGPPKNARDGDRLPAALDHALDRNLDPDEVYYFGIYAIYAMPDGRLFPAPGVVVSARPQPPIAPLGAPRLMREPGGRVRIDWLEAARGSVRILRTVGPCSRPPSTRLTTAEAEALDGRWIEPAGPDRAYDSEPPAESHGHCFYTPLVGSGGIWTVGHGVALSHVADPSDLRATRAGGGLGWSSGGMRVTLRWHWPAEANAALVVARQGTSPLGHNDPLALAATVLRPDYDRQDCWALTLPVTKALANGAGSANGENQASGYGSVAGPSDAGQWHIRVYSAIDSDGILAISPGLEPTAATVLPGPNSDVTVSYALKRPWLPGWPWSVTFRTEPAGTFVPAMVVVAQQRRVPLSVEDGTIIARFPPGRDGDQFPIRSALNLSKQSVRVFPDPNVEPQTLVPIRLRHPETGATVGRQ